MNREQLKEYQDHMGSPEIEYLQYLMEHPELQEDHPKEFDDVFQDNISEILA